MVQNKRGKCRKTDPGLIEATYNKRPVAEYCIYSRISGSWRRIIIPWFIAKAIHQIFQKSMGWLHCLCYAFFCIAYAVLWILPATGIGHFARFDLLVQW